MDRIAFFFREYYVYWSNVLLLVAVCVAIFLFLSLYLGRSGKMSAAFSVVPLAVFLSFFCARLMHWYCFSESYSGFAAAMRDYSQGGFALVGAFAAVVAEPMIAATAAMAVMSLAGERAAANSRGNGSMQVNFLDELYNLK